MTIRCGYTTALRDGYAFPMALAAIVVVSLIIGVAAVQVQRGMESYARQEEDFDRNVLAISADQTFLYHALTSPMASRGVEIGGLSATDRLIGRTVADPESVTLLRANGEPRLYAGDMVVRYLDQQSFFNAAVLGIEGRDARMTALGIPEIRQAALGAALADYQDDDDLRRPGGAERAAYADPDMPPNRPLISPLEICQVAGWAREDICTDHNRLLLLTMNRGTRQINARLAGMPMLRLLTGTVEDAEEAAQDYRDGFLVDFAGIDWPELDPMTDILSAPTSATGQFAVIVHDRPARHAWISVYTLTPESVRAPFSLAYRYRIGGEYVRDVLGMTADESIQPLPEAGR
ncbi:hypothetical protein GCM10017621_21900 [Maricaulis virginensis]|uniref:T2SS protein K first SAM-like domain-containing protein n=2 Tax=Maricaulis virginensis TaxID=144022 RepID=A0A9W6ILU1_9PROT|nr:hypothetical protein GCM10017621_21900 [Maricaulis virginensis]